MNKERCPWCEADDLYRDYHDKEWGRAVNDDAVFFEFIVLESFQAGLSWHTILKKRENFRKAFDNFDYHTVADYDDTKVENLLQNEGIIRHRQKIYAAIANAQTFLNIQKEFGSFSKYIWAFTNNTVIDNLPKKMSDINATTPLSDSISKDLKKRGFKFMGSTTVYAFLQATGIVNDHLLHCFVRHEKSQNI